MRDDLGSQSEDPEGAELMRNPLARDVIFQQPHAAMATAASGASWALIAFEALCAVSVLWNASSLASDDKSWLMFKLFYFPLLPFVAMLWLWGLNVKIWSQLRLNYTKVFSIEDQVFLPCHEDLFALAHTLLALVLASAAVFMLCRSRELDELADRQALLLYLALVGLAFLPGRLAFGAQRRFFLATLLRVVLPFQEVTFADFLLADVLTSLAKPLSDVGVVACHAAWTAFPGVLMQVTGDAGRGGAPQREGLRCDPTSWTAAVVLALPYLWRLCQCLRVHRSSGDRSQLANACKYATAFPVILLSAAKFHIERDRWLGLYRPAWIVCAVVNSGFSYYWDVTKDWDLGLIPLGKLRGDRVYESKRAYAFAAATNLLLRITWTLKLSAQLRHMYGVSLLISLLEVYRRFQWLFLRIEVALLKEVRKVHTPISKGVAALDHRL